MENLIKIILGFVYRWSNNAMAKEQSFRIVNLLNIILLHWKYVVSDTIIILIEASYNNACEYGNVRNHLLVIANKLLLELMFPSICTSITNVTHNR